MKSNPLEVTATPCDRTANPFEKRNRLHLDEHGRVAVEQDAPLPSPIPSNPPAAAKTATPAEAEALRLNLLHECIHILANDTGRKR